MPKTYNIFIVKAERLDQAKRVRRWLDDENLEFDEYFGSYVKGRHYKPLLMP